MNSGSFFQFQSLAVLVLMAVGIIYRKRPHIHVKVMATAIAWDFLLILQIELNRGAIAKAAQVTNNTLLLKIHVGLAFLCVLGHISSIITGRRLLKGDYSLRPWHKRLGLSVVVIRVLVFITSFWAVSLPPSN